MQAFLNLIAHHVHLHYKDSVENVCIVLPSKRGAIFLKDHFHKVFTKTTWLPDIQSAEDFIEELSGLKQADEIDLIAFLYESYLACFTGEKEPFDKFSKWGHLMIQDFNEIDRYLVDAKQIYQNLTHIKEIENWSLGQEELSVTQKNYLDFMGGIGDIYQHFSKELLKRGIGYQGLIYRKASENFLSSLQINTDHSVLNKYSKILFCGFNALNAAETKIYKHLQSSGKAEMLWDIDNYYFEDETQEAGLFLRKNFLEFDKRQSSFIGDHFKTNKEIHITSVAGQMGQAQLVHDELLKLISKGVSLTKVAVVLANEKLLWPVLKVLPKEVEHVNITMEYPIKYTQAYSFMDLLFTIQLNFQAKGRTLGTVYYKEFISVLQHPFFGVLLKSLDQTFNVSAIVDQITRDNFVFIGQKYIRDVFNQLPPVVSHIFKPWPSSFEGNNILVSVIELIRGYYIRLFESNITHLELEYMEVLLRSFKRIHDVIQKYPLYYADIRSYRQLYVQTVGSATVPFIGEPLKGLQIMGVLETRTLDFEYLIMVGVNEGVLPSGKSINSFLPNDLKRVFNLPLYYEKDAIYAYHFYRLLQRSNYVHLIYDSETDEFGKGEKSRFISQLQFELKHYHSGHQITDHVAVSTSPVHVDDTIKVEKSSQILEKIYSKLKGSDKFGGISPSALNTFKECSLKFYFRYGAGLKEIKEVEESAEANTFGSILHLALENLYKPYVGRILTEEDMLKIRTECDKEVVGAFGQFFKETSIQGKNYLQIEVLKVYVKRLIDQDIDNVKQLKKQNKNLTILHLESPWQVPLQVTINSKQETIYVQGKIDRIDNFGGQIRVIDYKNSISSDDKFTFQHLETLFEDVAYNKQLQLFIYVWLVYKNEPKYLKGIQPGIIPFKKFLKKPKQITVGKSAEALEFNEELMKNFEDHLNSFIAGILDLTVPFGQTDDKDLCQFCDFKAICNR